MARFTTRGWLAAIVLLVACSNQSPAAAHTQTPAASPAQWLCSLAVIEGWPPGSGTVQPGFQPLPDGKFVPVTDTGHPYWDRPMKRWVAVGPPDLAADGRRYAYITGGSASSDVHVVDVATGADRVIASGGPWQVAGWGTDAVFATRVEYVDSVAYGTIGFGKGLWELPLDGSKPLQFTNDSMIWRWVGGGGVWSGGPFDVAGGPNAVSRFDLQTMQTTTLFSHGERSRVLAIEASGAAVILTEGSVDQLWRVSAAGDSTGVWLGNTAGLRPESPVAVDGSDVWLSSAMPPPESQWAIFHLSVAGPLQQVAPFTDRPVQVAGGCR